MGQIEFGFALCGNSNFSLGGRSLNINAFEAERTIVHAKGIYRRNDILCAGTPKNEGIVNSAQCRGDSGGPLTVLKNDRHMVVGVVSFGPEVCEVRVKKRR